MYSFLYIFFIFCFVDVYLFISSFSLWQMSSELEVYFGFEDGASQHTRSLASAAWVIFKPRGQLLSFKGICVRVATKKCHRVQHNDRVSS
jgi:hypothetical protein